MKAEQNWTKDFEAAIQAEKEQINALFAQLQALKDEKDKAEGEWRSLADAAEALCNVKINNNCCVHLPRGGEQIAIACLHFGDTLRIYDDIAKGLGWVKLPKAAEMLEQMAEIIRSIDKNKPKLLQTGKKFNEMRKTVCELQQKTREIRSEIWKRINTVEMLKAFAMINEGGFREDYNTRNHTNREIASCELKQLAKYFIFKVGLTDGTAKEIHQSKDEFHWEKEFEALDENNEKSNGRTYFYTYKNSSSVGGCTDSFNEWDKNLLLKEDI